MSEIKGQLLGIILVLAIFATMAGVMKSAFKTIGDKVSTEVSSTITEVDKSAA